MLSVIVNWAQYIGVGLMVGTVSGLLGIGGGILMVPLIVLLWKPDQDGVKIAIGTSLAVMIPTAIAGTLRHRAFGNVDFLLAACLAVGAVLGTLFIGAPLAERLPAGLLKRMFGVLMVVSGLKWSGAFEIVGKLFGGGAGGGQ